MKSIIQSTDKRIETYTDAARRMQQGDFSVRILADASDPVGQLGLALDKLSETLDQQYRNLKMLDDITLYVNSGLTLAEIMDNIYDQFKPLIPYTRLGLSLIDESGMNVFAHWSRSDHPEVKIGKGYTAPLAGSSLQTILQTNQPRIINDLVAYLAQKPYSESTQRIVDEGIRSSLTCPLIGNGKAVGFLFFSHDEPDTYANVHVDIFQRIAKQVSVIVEKGRFVSELAEKKVAIEQKNEELRQLNDFKNTFLGMVAHDLRSPVSIMRMALDLILSPDIELTPEELDEVQTDMSRQVEHMRILLEDLLNVTEIEAGKLILDLREVDLVAYLETVVRRHNQLASPKGTVITLQVQGTETVSADEHRLRQVIDNLISNAVKYSPLGSSIDVFTEDQGDYWCVHVRDEGPGLSEADQERLFGVFARLTPQPTGGEKSIGLGLMISRRVVEAHGGQIGVITRCGEGSTFWFTLKKA